MPGTARFSGDLHATGAGLAEPPLPQVRGRIVEAFLEETCVPLYRPAGGSSTAPLVRRLRVLHLRADDGATGCGEASPVDWLAPGPAPGLEQDCAKDSAQASAKDARGERPRTQAASAGSTTDDLAAAQLLTDIRTEHPSGNDLLRRSLDARLPASLRAGLQCALLDLEARRRGQPLATLLAPGCTPREVPLSALVGDDEPEAMATEAAALAQRGFASFKVKVGRPRLADDVARVRAVREAVGPGAELRLDANRAWTLEEAVEALQALQAFAPRFVEEPLARVHDLEHLDPAIAVALDESVRDEADLQALMRLRKASFLVLKLERVGGPLPAMRLAEQARLEGLRVVFTDSIEGPVGREATRQAAIAAAQPRDAVEAVGLGGLFLLEEGGPNEARQYEGVQRETAVLEAGLHQGPGPEAAQREDRQQHEAAAGEAGPHEAQDPEAAILESGHPEAATHGCDAQGFDAERPWLAERARVAPDDVALVADGRCWSWQQLAREASARSASMTAAGVAAGDLVAVDLPPGAAFVATLHALQSLGAAMLPLNRRLSEPERRAILGHAAPQALLDEHGFHRLAARGPGAPALRPLPATLAQLDPQAALTVVFTSGTTSRPKGVVLTNANHRAAAEASRRRLGHGPGDAWLAAMPLFHVGGIAILVRSVLDGSRVLLEPGFDAARMRDALASGEATMVSLVPTMLARVLESPLPAASPRLRAVLVGGAALSPSLARRTLDAGLPLATTWGMTEACSQLCTTEPGDPRAATGSVGLPLPGVEVQVRDPDASGVGEFCVRGANVTRGYLRHPEADAAAFEDGWLRTGDLGSVAADGSVTVSGRRDDLILSGGENVSPLEVERILDAHPGVAESMVFGKPDEEWGQRVAALVVPAMATHAGTTAGPTANAADLDAWCRRSLAGYKVPREFRFVDELPRNATGKLMRRAPR